MSTHLHHPAVRGEKLANFREKRGGRKKKKTMIRQLYIIKKTSRALLHSEIDIRKSAHKGKREALFSRSSFGRKLSREGEGGRKRILSIPLQPQGKKREGGGKKDEDHSKNL